jgi:hypothetical protein
MLNDISSSLEEGKATATIQSFSDVPNETTTEVCNLPKILARKAIGRKVIEFRFGWT